MTVSARFRNRASVADVTPTNVYYQLTDAASGDIITNWTSLTVTNPLSITLTSTQNKILNDTRQLERKQLAVATDYGLSTQYVDSMTFDVKNLSGIL